MLSLVLTVGIFGERDGVKCKFDGNCAAAAVAIFFLQIEDKVKWNVIVEVKSCWCY